jgi:hypothetical protein
VQLAHKMRDLTQKTGDLYGLRFRASVSGFRV